MHGKTVCDSEGGCKYANKVYENLEASGEFVTKCETEATPKFSCGFKGCVNYVCGAGRTCSKYGWCGSTSEYKDSTKTKFSNN